MLKENLPKFLPCRSCATTEGDTKPEGYKYITLENEQTAITECACHRDWRQLAELIVKSEKANLWHDETSLVYYPPKDYAGSKSLPSLGKLTLYLNHIHESKYRAASLYLYGPYGTQKTTLGQWLGRRLLTMGNSVRYITMQQLVSTLSSNFDSDEEKMKDVEALLSVDFLIVDEAFTKSKVVLYRSGYQLPFLETFLKDRMDQRKKSCIFISNTAITDIASQGFGESIQNFIDRSITPKRTALEFLDVYMQEKSNASINIDALF